VVPSVLFAALKPLGKILLEGIVDRAAGQAAVVDLQLAGFIGAMAAKDAYDSRFVVAQKPGESERRPRRRFHLLFSMTIGN